MDGSTAIRVALVAGIVLGAALASGCTGSAVGAQADGTSNEEATPMKPGASNPGGPPPPGLHAGRAVGVIVTDGEIFLHQLYGGIRKQVTAGTPAAEVIPELEGLRTRYEPLLVSVGEERDRLGPDPRAEFDRAWTSSVAVAQQRFLQGDEFTGGRDRLVAEDPAVAELLDGLIAMHVLVKLDQLRVDDPERAARLGVD